MSKVNTLFNYFTSPKGSSPKQNVEKTPKTKPETPKRSTPKNKGSTPKTAKNKGKENRSLANLKKLSYHNGEEKEEEETNEEPNQSEPSKTTPTKNSAKKDDSGNRSRRSAKRRRIYVESDDDEDNEDEGSKIDFPGSTPKKPRLIIPDVESDASDEYVPELNKTAESDSASEGVTESEIEPETEEETPEKKPRMSSNKNSKSTKKTEKTRKPDKPEPKPSNQQSNSGGGSTANEAWPHLKYDFLQPNKIQDINRRRPNDPNYDPRTVFVPKEFLIDQTPAMRQWWDLKSRHYDCILFFKVGKFYELYHMDAVTGVNECNLTFMRGGFAHSGFPEIGYGRFAASLIERGFKVARIEQTETPDMVTQRCNKMSKSTKFDRVVKREICQISTKGTRVFTALDVGASTPQSNYFLSLVERYDLRKNISSYGVCFLDTTIGDFNLGQFEDDRCTSRLLTLLAHYPPTHIVYERGNLTPKTLQILNTLLAASLKEPLQHEVQFWSASTTLKNLLEGEYFKSSKESEFSWPEGLRPYLNEGDSLGLTPCYEKELAVQALGGCIYLLKDYLLDQQLLAPKRFKTYAPPDSSNENIGSQFQSNMVLDAVTINNLRIFGEGSLNNTLDHCCTAFGKRLLREWICRPSCNKAIIKQRQEAIKELMNQTEVVQNVRSILATLPDLERLLSKIHALGNSARMWNHPDGRAIMFEGHTYSKRKITDFTTTLEGFEKVLTVIAMFDDFSNELINDCTKQEPHGNFPQLKDKLDYFKTAFDHEEAKKVGSIVPKTGVDDEYDAVLNELDEIKKDANKYLEQQKRHFGGKVVFFGSDKKRYQIEISDSLSKKVGFGYELASQRKGFKRYYTEEAKELLSRQISAEDSRDKVIKDLNRRLFAQFSEQYDMWNLVVKKIATLDVLISLTEYAHNGEMCIPEIEDNHNVEKIILDIKEGRHPCIQSDNFIPNDSTMGTEGYAPLIILTGPNMGGKSTLMRQVGLIAIMAQMGCHVPASSCNLTLIDRIFTRLGANDDILAGQSTFLVELRETAVILQHATSHSLVLLDELGRGTSTYDGTAIAASVVDALTTMNCRTLFSTHYHSLVEDYKNNKNVTLAHMACMVETEEEEQVTQETVTFLYKLSDGPCPKSYGFNAARLAGIPSVITNKAHEISNKLEQESNYRQNFIAICKSSKSALKKLIVNIKKIL